MHCPGSTALLRHLNMPETDEPDYRRDGTAAHEAASFCLEQGLDAWEVMGQSFHNTPVDKTIADAIQTYLDEVRPLMALPGAEVFIEQKIGPLEEQPLFYGTVDCGVIVGDTIYVNDYKHGEGVVVEVDDNSQLKYYAYGLLRHPDASKVTKVVLRIVQPRAFHVEGPVRVWETSAVYVRSWAEGELLPAMERSALDDTFDAGKWCRFCPAKLVCPLLKGMFKAATTGAKDLGVEVLQVTASQELSDQSLRNEYEQIAAVRLYMGALETEALRRLNTGAVIEGLKLVHKKANRVFKDEAAAIFKARFGDKAMSEPSLRSPAEMEKVGGDAKALVKEWAYTPTSGLTVALEGDNRPAVKVMSTTDTFAAALTKV